VTDRPTDGYTRPLPPTSTTHDDKQHEQSPKKKASPAKGKGKGKKAAGKGKGEAAAKKKGTPTKRDPVRGKDECGCAWAVFVVSLGVCVCAVLCG
jgi:hypothetical protein